MLIVPGGHVADAYGSENKSGVPFPPAPTFDTSDREIYGRQLADYADRVDVVQADGLREESLIDALAPGYDAVVSIVGASTPLQARRVTDLYSATTRNLLAAMKQTGNTKGLEGLAKAVPAVRPLLDAMSAQA